MQKYQDILLKHIKYHRLDKKINQLFKEASSGSWSITLGESYKKVDRLLTRLQLARGNPFNSNKMKKLGQLLSIEQSLLNIPIIDVVQHLRASRQTLKDYQNKHQSLREEHLTVLTEARVLAKHPSNQFKGIKPLNQKIK